MTAVASRRHIVGLVVAVGVLVAFDAAFVAAATGNATATVQHRRSPTRTFDNATASRVGSLSLSRNTATSSLTLPPTPTLGNTPSTSVSDDTASLDGSRSVGVSGSATLSLTDTAHEATETAVASESESASLPIPPTRTRTGTLPTPPPTPALPPPPLYGAPADVTRDAVAGIAGMGGAAGLVGLGLFGATVGHPVLIARLTAVTSMSGLPWCAAGVAQSYPSYVHRAFIPTAVVFFDSPSRESQFGTTALIMAAMPLLSLGLAFVAAVRRRHQLDKAMQENVDRALERAVGSGLPVVRRIIRDEAAAMPAPPPTTAVALARHAARWLVCYGAPVAVACGFSVATEGGDLSTPVGFVSTAVAALAALVPYLAHAATASGGEAAKGVFTFFWGDSRKRKNAITTASSPSPTVARPAWDSAVGGTDTLDGEAVTPLPPLLWPLAELMASAAVSVMAIGISPDDPASCVTLGYAACGVLGALLAFVVAVRPHRSGVGNFALIAALLPLPVTSAMAATVADKTAVAIGRSRLQQVTAAVVVDEQTPLVDTFMLGTPLIVCYLALFVAGVVTALEEYAQRSAALKTYGSTGAHRAPPIKVAKLLQEPARRGGPPNNPVDPLFVPQPANPLTELVARLRITQSPERLHHERTQAAAELFAPLPDQSARDEVERCEMYGGRPPAGAVARMLEDNTSRPLWGSPKDAAHVAHEQYLPMNSPAWLAHQHNVDTRAAAQEEADALSAAEEEEMDDWVDDEPTLRAPSRSRSMVVGGAAAQRSASRRRRLGLDEPLVHDDDDDDDGRYDDGDTDYTSWGDRSRSHRSYRSHSRGGASSRGGGRYDML